MTGNINMIAALEMGIVDEVCVGERRNYICFLRNGDIWATLEEVPYEEGRKLIEKAKSLGIKVVALAYGSLFEL